MRVTIRLVLARCLDPTFLLYTRIKLCLQHLALYLIVRRICFGYQWARKSSDVGNAPLLWSCQKTIAGGYSVLVLQSATVRWRAIANSQRNFFLRVQVTLNWRSKYCILHVRRFLNSLRTAPAEITMLAILFIGAIAIVMFTNSSFHRDPAGLKIYLPAIRKYFRNVIYTMITHKNSNLNFYSCVTTRDCKHTMII